MEKLFENLIKICEPVFNKYTDLKTLPLMQWGRFYKYECAGESFFRTSGEGLLTSDIEEELQMDILDKIDVDEDLIITSFFENLFNKYDYDNKTRKKLVNKFGFDDRGGMTLVIVKDNDTFKFEAFESDSGE